MVTLFHRMEAISSNCVRDDHFAKLPTCKVSNFNEAHTAWKVSEHGFFFGPYFSVFGQNTGKYEPRKLRNETIFTQRQLVTPPINGLCWDLIWTHYSPVLLFCTPWKGFLMFSGAIEKQHWAVMG